jgi:hypothetical protein
MRGHLEVFTAIGLGLGLAMAFVQGRSPNKIR